MDQDTPGINDSNEGFDVEALIGMEPDVFVTITWHPEELNSVWGVDEDIYDRVNTVVPIIAISATGAVNENILRFAELAALLGADLQSAENVAAKETFDHAVTDLQAAIAEPETDMLFAYMTEENEWYAAGPNTSTLFQHHLPANTRPCFIIVNVM